MVDNNDIPDDKLQDRAVVQSETEETPSSRDGARTPMQWDKSANAGFSFGKIVDPWLPVHENYLELNVETALQQPDSILNFYRQLLQIRKQSNALRRGKWRTLLHYPHEHMVYVRETKRETVLIAINFSYEQPFTINDPIDRESWTVLLSTHYESGKIIDLADNLNPFEVSILQKMRND